MASVNDLGERSALQAEPRISKQVEPEGDASIPILPSLDRDFHREAIATRPAEPATAYVAASFIPPTHAFDPLSEVPLVGDLDRFLFRARPNLSLAASLDGEVRGSRSRVRYLEIQLARLGSLDLLPLEWAKTAHPARVPTPEIASQMVAAMEGIRVLLTKDEGFWLSDRFRCDDWSAWGGDIELAIIQKLGPERLVREMPKRELSELLDWYEGDGLFKEG